MYHNIDFTELGGFPLTQDTMEFIQKSYNDVLGVFTGIAGKYIILTGLTETTPNNFTNGWVIVDGEIVPFVGGIGQPSVVVTQTTENYTFRDNSVHPVIIQRVAGFAVSGGTPFTSFVRLSLTGLKTYIDTVNVTANTALTIANTALAGTISPGMILMWSGNPASVPTGWRLCDGLDGRPNLKGKFIVGFSATTGTYTMGATGGAASIQLATNQMPTHTHTISDPGHNHANGAFQYLLQSNGVNTIHDVDSTSGEPNLVSKGAIASKTTGITLGNAGGNIAHENRPPYYTLAYIIKV